VDRLVSGDIPVAPNKGPAHKRLSGKNGRDHRTRRPVRVHRRDVGPDGPLPLGCLDIGCDPQHVPGGVHALEDRAGAPDQLLGCVHYRRERLHVVVLIHPLLSHPHLAQADALGLLSVEVNRRPVLRRAAECHLAGAPDFLAGHVQRGASAFLQRLLLRFAHCVDAHHDAIEILICNRGRTALGRSGHGPALAQSQERHSHQGDGSEPNPDGHQLRRELHAPKHRVLLCGTHARRDVSAREYPHP